MKTIEKIKSSYERLKELDAEVLLIEKMCKKLAEGDSSIASLELSIKAPEQFISFDSHGGFVDSMYKDHMDGIFKHIYGSPFSVVNEKNEKISKDPAEPKLLLEYAFAITFLDLLINHKNKERKYHLDFLNQFETN